MPTLHWLTRETDLKLSGLAPYRLLEAVDELSYGDLSTGNMLIQGDNLDALKALLPYYGGSIKCIYVDPPFNTGQAFKDYDDNLEHSIWLRMMYPRFEMLRELLEPSGTIVVHLDDNELGYAIVILDEIFGRKNRINICTFRQGAAVGHKAINPGLVTVTNYILIYARDKSAYWKPNKIFTQRQRDERYSSYINNYDDHYSCWKLIPLLKAFCAKYSKSVKEVKALLGENYASEIDKFVYDNADRVVQPVQPDYKNIGQETRDLIDKSKESPAVVFLQEREGFPDIYINNGKRWLFYRGKLKHIDGELVSGEPLTNLWDDLLSNNLHNEGGVTFPKGKKPEALIKRVLELFSSPEDLVLDSFLGSGTTAAVAHKMGRRYIGIERGEQATTLCVPRMTRVVEGEQGGISKAVSWHGGGGFRFYKLGDPIFDEDGSVRAGITYAQLAAHVWFSETKTPLASKPDTPLLGVHNGAAYYLLFNGILKDKSVGGGNVLTAKILEGLPPHDGPKVIYGERCLFGSGRLKEERITFKHTPYDIKGR